MRQILVDRARKRGSQKRGGDQIRVTLSELGDARELVDLIAIDGAMRRLEALSERQARIVELRFLVGLTVAETAEVLDLSERTVHADWRMARAWLIRELADTNDGA
jgi:RNA polymerase sigma factor (TIGR02999 family)